MNNNQSENYELIACHECDLLLKLENFSEGYKANCPRCGHLISKKIKNSKSKAVAFALSAAIFFTLSFPFDFLAFDFNGKQRVISLFDSVKSMFLIDFDVIGFILVVTTVIIPFIFLNSLIFVVVAIKFNCFPVMAKKILKGFTFLLDWNMAEIFLISILVSFIKILTLAELEFGLSFFAYIIFIIFLAATSASIDKFQLWRWVKRID